MKRILLTLIPLLFILTVNAQISDSARSSNEKVFTSVQQVPEFTGGIEKFYHYLQSTLRYPATAREHNTQGRVIVTMVVEKDGSLSQVKVARGIGDGCDEEAVRVVKLSSPWTSGMQNGRAVRVA
jgi:protein TonB